MKYILLFILFSCAAYTDPEQEKLTYYLCDKKHEIVVKHSDDYESIVIKYNQEQQVLLHHFVTEAGVGYRADNLLWLTQGKKGLLIEKLQDGSEKKLFEECVAEKVDLQY